MTPELVPEEYVGKCRIRFELGDGCAGEVVEPLTEQDVFRAFQLNEELSAGTWSSGADLAPEVLYEQAAHPGAAAGRAPRGSAKR